MVPVEGFHAEHGFIGGDHACLFFENEEERRTRAEQVIMDAWGRGERVLWVGDPAATGGSDTADRAWLDGLAEEHERAGPEPLVFVDIEEYRAKAGGLAPGRLASLLQRELFRALVDGCSGLQVIQDVSAWTDVLGGGHGSILRYETELSTFLPGSRCSVLCLYAMDGPDAQDQLAVLETHPQTVEDGKLWENLYAVPPEDLLRLSAPRSTFQRRLANLARHRESEHARRRHTDLIELLHAVSEASHETSTVDELIHVTVERICTNLSWHVGHAYRATPNTGEPVAEPTGLWFLDGEDDDFREFRALTESMRFPGGVGLPGTALERRETLWIEDVHEDPNFRRLPTAGEGRLTTALAVPVVSDSRVLAVLEFFSRDRRPVDEHMIEIVREVASQLAVSVERMGVQAEMRLLESGVRHVRDAIVITTSDLRDDGPRIVYANPAFETVTGYSAAEAAGEPMSLLFGPKSNPVVQRRASRGMSEGRAAGGEVIAYRKDGSEFVLQWSVSPVRASGGRTTHFVSILRDVTDQRRAEEAARRADHDSLTGLPNRDLFMRRLERAVERARTGDDEDRFAVLFLDLDRFKVINDSLGHLRGDQLLTALGRRLEQAVRPGDLVARLGGDEFVILLDRMEDAADATNAADRIMEALRPPFDLDGEAIYTSASVGIALSDTGYLLPEDVLRDADAAMYRAKSAGKARYQFFDQTLFDNAVSTLRLETSLRKAVQEGQFELFYQPIVSLTNGRTRGMEALLRWHHPERGLLEPAAFMGLAVDTGLIVPIGRWVLAEACRQMQSWQAKYEDATHLFLSLNLSPPEFRNGHDVPDLIHDALKSHEIVAGTLQIEITENVFIDRPSRVERTLARIRDMGVRICLDDFGTGYSSLSYLHRFPVEGLKVDKVFVGRLGNGRPGLKRDEEIVRSILALAKNLDLDVTAEGVETRRQVRRLQHMGCPTAQGFYFAKPLAAREVERFFKGEPAHVEQSSGGSSGPGSRGAGT